MCAAAAAAAGPAKPLALVLVPAKDATGAFRTDEGSDIGQMISTLKKTHDVVIKKIKSVEDFIQAVTSDDPRYEDREFSILVINGHGTPRSIEVNEKEWYVSPRAEHFVKLAKNGMVIVNSCSTGSEIAKDISRVANRLVFAPIKPCAEVQLCKINEKIFPMFYETNINPLEGDITRIFHPYNKAIKDEDLSAAIDSIVDSINIKNLSNAFKLINENFNHFLSQWPNDEKMDVINEAYLPLIRAFIQEKEFDKAISLIYETKAIVMSTSLPLDENLKSIREELFNVALSLFKKADLDKEGEIEKILELCCNDMNEEAFTFFLISFAQHYMGKIEPKKMLAILKKVFEFVINLPPEMEKAEALKSFAALNEKFKRLP